MVFMKLEEDHLNVRFRNCHLNGVIGDKVSVGFVLGFLWFVFYCILLLLLLLNLGPHPSQDLLAYSELTPDCLEDHMLCWG